MRAVCGAGGNGQAILIADAGDDIAVGSADIAGNGYDYAGGPFPVVSLSAAASSFETNLTDFLWEIVDAPDASAVRFGRWQVNSVDMTAPARRARLHLNLAAQGGAAGVATAYGPLTYFQPDAEGDYTIKLTITDGCGISEDQLTLTAVCSRDLIPIARALPVRGGTSNAQAEFAGDAWGISGRATGGALPTTDAAVGALGAGADVVVFVGNALAHFAPSALRMRAIKTSIAKTREAARVSPGDPIPPQASGAAGIVFGAATTWAAPATIILNGSLSDLGP